MCSSVLGSNSGAKNPIPSTWSRWKCVRQRWISRGSSRTSSRPRFRIPVPASNTISAPSDSSTATHEVLPPNSSVLGPGVAREPRQPQMVISTPLLPEDDDEPDEVAPPLEEREGCRLEVVSLAVEALDPDRAGGRTLLEECNSRRHLGQRHRSAVRV